MKDWTRASDGRSNSSEAYSFICRHVERLIRSDAHRLLSGRADDTAGLIVAQMAHVFGMTPDEQMFAKAYKEREGCYDAPPLYEPKTVKEVV